MKLIREIIADEDYIELIITRKELTEVSDLHFLGKEIKLDGQTVNVSIVLETR